MYNIDDLWDQLLFFGEYTIGAIGSKAKNFFFYVDAKQYNPEGLLFHIYRNFLNFVRADGLHEEFSPEAFKLDPEKWFGRAIYASFQQHIWESTGKVPFIHRSSNLIAKEYLYDQEKVVFTKCGLKFIKIYRQSLKRLTPYPQALDIK